MSNKDPYKIKRHLKTLSEIEEEVIKQKREAEGALKHAKDPLHQKDAPVFNQKIFGGGKDIAKRNFNASVSDFNKTSLDHQLSFLYLNELKTDSDIKSLGKIDLNQVKNFEAIYDDARGCFKINVTTYDNKQHLLKGIRLDYEDVNGLVGNLSEKQKVHFKKLIEKHSLDVDVENITTTDRKVNMQSSGNILKGRISTWVRENTIFKGRINRWLSSKKAKVVKWINKNTIFKGRMRAFTGGLRRSVRSGVRNLIAKPLSNASKAIVSNLGGILKGFSTLLLKLLANPVVLAVVVGVIVVVVLVSSLIPPVSYPAMIAHEDSGTYNAENVGQSEMFGPLYDRYQDFSDIGKQLADVYGVYFSVIDAYTVGVSIASSLLYLDADKLDVELKRLGIDWNANQFVNDVFMLQLGPMKTRVEYFHREWSAWTTGYTSIPAGYDHVRSYTVTSRTWVAPVDNRRKFCSMVGNEHITWEVGLNTDCPEWASAWYGGDTVAGYWVEGNTKYWDGRNIVDEWWDVSNENIANINDGIANTAYYTYSDVALPDVGSPTCKGCGIRLVVSSSGNISREVDYWTIKTWDEFTQDLMAIRPVSKDLEEYFNVSHVDELQWVYVSEKLVEFTSSLVVSTNDSAVDVNVGSMFVNHYFDKPVYTMVRGIEGIYEERLENNLSVYRTLFAHILGDPGATISLLEKMRHPVNGPTTVSSPFGMRTLGGTYAMHYAMDFASPIGTQLVSVLDGGVVVMSYNGCPTRGSLGDMCGPQGWDGGGNQVIVKYNVITLSGERIDLFVGYSHMQLNSIVVSNGDVVNKGDLLGGMGSSGNSTGSHVHFAVWVYGDDGSINWVNPEYIIE